MRYPKAPWLIQGYGFQTLQLMDTDRVSPHLPPELEVVSMLPGKTLGGVYLASYSDGSALIYNELIVVGAIVRHAGSVGSWITHIYVDHPDSVAGGREIWGLPKELAQFTWEMGDNPSVQVNQAEQLLCKLTCKWQLPGWQQPLATSVFSTLDSKLMQFESKGMLKVHPAYLELQVPAESHFSELGIGQPWLGFYLNPLSLTINAPAIVQD